MNKFGAMRSEAVQKFGDDPNKAAIASRSLDFLEEWSQLSGCDGCNLNVLTRWKRKRECSQYIKAGLKRAREEEHGFLGALLSAVAFQIVVQLIVKWIMERFFDK